MIQHAASLYRDGIFGELLGRDGTPYGPGDEPDWAFLSEVLFRDDDVLLLFDPSNDGIEDPSSELHQRWRLANLHPQTWFLPFADVAEQ